MLFSCGRAMLVSDALILPIILGDSTCQIRLIFCVLLQRPVPPVSAEFVGKLDFAGGVPLLGRFWLATTHLHANFATTHVAV